jgi:hypothetical protein
MMLIVAPPRSGCRYHRPPCASTMVSRHVLFTATETIHDCIRHLISIPELLRHAGRHRAVGPTLQWHRGHHFKSNGGQSQARAEATHRSKPGQKGDARFQICRNERVRVERDDDADIVRKIIFCDPCVAHQRNRRHISGPHAQASSAAVRVRGFRNERTPHSSPPSSRKGPSVTDTRSVPDDRPGPARSSTSGPGLRDLEQSTSL